MQTEVSFLLGDSVPKTQSTETDSVIGELIPRLDNVFVDEEVLFVTGFYLSGGRSFLLTALVNSRTAAEPQA